MLTARSKVNKNVSGIGSRPVGSFELQSEKEIADKKNKVIRFLILDVVVLIALVLFLLATVFRVNPRQSCESFVLPPLITTFVLVFSSLVVDAVVWR